MRRNKETEIGGDDLQKTSGLDKACVVAGPWKTRRVWCAKTK